MNIISAQHFILLTIGNVQSTNLDLNISLDSLVLDFSISDLGWDCLDLVNSAGLDLQQTVSSTMKDDNVSVASIASGVVNTRS